MNSQTFQSRRTYLASQLQPGVVVLPTAPEVIRNADTYFPYRFDSSFYYLTGFTEPESVFVQVIHEDKVENLLFCREKNPDQEIWDGYRLGPQAAAEKFGFDAAFPITELDHRMVEILKNQPRVYFAFGKSPAFDSQVGLWVETLRKQARSGVSVPHEMSDLCTVINEMRLLKDEDEIALLRKAGQISTAAHIRAMQAARSGLPEYALEAELLYDFYRQASRFPAYNSIVASGPNACVLHYVENKRILENGDLVLVDAGCELSGYASDITRTFPVNGRYSGAQKVLYELVLAAQTAAIALCRPGLPWNELHETVTRILATGLLDLGLLSGSLDSILEGKHYRQFFMHQTGHWLGMDVHDVGDYKQNGQWRTLMPGMVFTIEPGLYLRPAENVPAHFENMGIRIEDNILITAEGYENLTSACPKTILDIETVMTEAEQR